MENTVHIAWIHAGQVDNYFAISLLDLIKKFPDKIRSYNSIEGLGLLAKSRNLAVKHFLDNTTDEWLLFVDSDQFISIDSFNKLVESADTEHLVISGLVFGMANPTNLEPRPSIYKASKDGSISPFYDYPENSLVEISAAGTGALLIHRSVLETIRSLWSDQHGPDWCWFSDGPIGNNQWLSEDLMFSWKLVNAGIKMYAHTGAVFPHHKNIWLQESHYKKWLEEQNG